MSRRSRVARDRPPAKTSVPVAEDEDDSCIICAEPIDFSAVSPCNHPYCHKCMLRQRALYKRNACLVCRTENLTVIVSEQSDPVYESFAQDFVASKNGYGLLFTLDASRDASMSLLENTCQECNVTLPLFKELGDHARSQHNRYFCNICSRNKKAFVSELAMYSYKQLQRHQAEGDGKGFKGHPECQFCRNRFYSEDELNIHIRDRHERCYICDQNAPKTADYYKNYDHLYRHFKECHYVCSMPVCVEKKFVVFRDDIDLTAHMLKEHGGIAGSNGKVVLGSFQSHLTTFSNRSVQPEDVDESYDVKKLRLNERVKHYVKNDPRAVESFKKLVSDYRSKRVPSKVFVDKCKDLFKEYPDADIGLVLLGTAQLFGETSTQANELIAASSAFTFSPGVSRSATPTENFPALGNLSNTVNFNLWSSPINKKASLNDQFPALAKNKAPASKVPTNQPIRYTTVVKKQQGYSKVNVNSSQASPDYRPSYLSSSSTPSLPIKKNSLASASAPDLSESKFPALEKKPAKRVFPPVNPPKPASSTPWGAQPAPAKPTDDWGVPVVDKRKQKAKRK